MDRIATFGRFAVAVFASAGLAMASAKDAPTPVDLVNTYIGTGGGGVEYGGTMPVVGTPFAMTNWTAQTRQNRISVTSYAYEDTHIQGFIGTHQAAIWMGDYGYVTFMPEIGAINYAPEARQQVFDRKDETSTPYEYAVRMGSDAAHSVTTQMTATDHASFFRFDYPRGSNAGVLVEVTRPGIEGYVKVDAARREVSGYNPDRMDAHLGPMKLPHFKGYFVARFRQDFSAKTVYEGVLMWPGKDDVKGNNVGAFVSFDTTTSGRVEMQVGTSFISVEQARANLDTEMPDWDFARVRDSVKAAWNAKLGIAQVEATSPDDAAMFYSALYHALLYPKLFSEHGRYYSAFDDKVHAGESYTAYSIWDTFRAENSLITLFAPERVDGMVRALLQDYQEGGWMPKWPNPSYTNIMIGTHADAIVAEAVNKGFRGFDYTLAYAAVHKDATVPPDGDTTRRWFDREPHTPYEARAGLSYALKLGYIPNDKVSEAASSTQEESYDDFAVSQVARAVGNTADEAFFRERSLHYKNLFNPVRGFMQAKNSDGSWADPAEGWTEGDQWVYLFAALHDIPGVIELFGGQAKAAARLDEHFAGGHNRHDNEPSHHYGYLYDYMGQPWKTQARVRQLARDAYSNTPHGVMGNEDCGQMSAWYVFTAMGFYPVDPVSGDYLIGSPVLARVALALPNGKTFTVVAKGNAPSNVYIQSATLDGKPLDVPVISYARIQQGGVLALVMGSTPSAWGSHWHPKPL